MDPLSGLHDISLPDPISWWPLAYGWYLLIVIVVCASVALVWGVRRGKRERLHRDVLRMLEGADIAAISVLLRRIALFKYPRQDVAGLQGEAWLAFLDKTGKTTAFTEGEGRLLVTGPYQSDDVTVSDDFKKVIRGWVKAQELH